MDPDDVPIRLRGVQVLPPRALPGASDLTVMPGEVVAVAGPTGSGKTALVDLLLGVTRPHGGSIHVFGRPPGTATAAGLVAGLSRLTAEQLSATPAEVLPGLLTGTGRTPADVLAAAGLDGRADRALCSLSAGERQRLRLGVALVQPAPLLVLDDPTAELDGADLAGFGRAVREHAERGRTVAMTCRRLQDAAACADRLVVLAEGRVVVDTGRHADRRRLASLRRLTARVGGALTTDVMALPAVASAAIVDGRVSVLSVDADATVRALLVRYPQARSISVVEPTLQDLLAAFTGRC